LLARSRYVLQEITDLLTTVRIVRVRYSKKRSYKIEVSLGCPAAG
jgi:hypothetical protein